MELHVEKVGLIIVGVLLGLLTDSTGKV